MTDLSEFLLARIAEDQDTAQVEWDWMIERHGADYWTTGEGGPFTDEWRYETDRDSTLHVSPRRVLAECDAKRRIVENAVTNGDPDEYDEYDYVLGLLALPYADHPDYDQEWRP